MSKLRVGVLMGGRSQEREVSLNSGRTICDHLDTSCYHVVPLFQAYTNKLYLLPSAFLHRGKISDFEHRLEDEAEEISWHSLKALVDLVYIAQHGRFAEDGSLQGFLEVLGIPYCGSKVLASALGMDKIMQRHFLKAAGIKVPQAVVIPPHVSLGRTEDPELVSAIKELGFPCIVKPSREGSSLGITVIRSIEELPEALRCACTVTPGIAQPVMVEKYLTGMEFTCIVVTDYERGVPLPLPPTEIVLNGGSAYFDYEQKYMPGKAIKHTPARCTASQLKRIQNECVKVMEVLSIRTLARVDGFLTADDQIVIIDPNTFSGMDPASFAFVAAAEINMGHTQFINHLIQTELHAYDKVPTMNKNAQAPSAERIRVGVLLAGASNEREISLATGRNVLYKLSPQKYEGVPLFVNSRGELYRINQRLLVRNTTAEIEAELTPDLHIAWSDLAQHVDFVFNGLHGGHGENGCVQGALDTLGIPYNGSSVLASALCMDKYKTTQLLRHMKVGVPQALLIERSEWQAGTTFEPPCGYPCIVKPNDDGCSVLVSKAKSPAEFKAAVELIFSSGKNEALVEELITGIELTVGVVGNTHPYALPPSMAVAQQDVLSIQEKFLPGAGENQTPAPVSAQVTALVKRVMEGAYSAVGCQGYARIDCFYQPSNWSPTGQDRVVILEINTLPALTPATCLFAQAAEVGLRPMEFIDLLIQLGLENHASPLLDKQPSENVQKFYEQALRQRECA